MSTCIVLGQQAIIIVHLRPCATIVRFSQGEASLWLNAAFTITLCVDQFPYSETKNTLLSHPFEALTNRQTVRLTRMHVGQIDDNWRIVDESCGDVTVIA